jgi:lipoprotein-anchoring transpeptidase ErfK/SrfK
MRKKHLFFLLPLLILGGLVLYLSLDRTRLDGMDPVDPETLVSEYDQSAKLAYFQSKQIEVPSQDKLTATPKVLGNSRAYKWIEVDLTNQKLYAYEDGRKVFDFFVSTGTYDRTPTGVFRIWTKIRSTKMSGGSKELGTYYYLPNVPYVMFFYNDEVPMHIGYSLHGTYWHDNFGTPMSHGCVNMKTEEIAELYHWAQPDLQGKTSMRASADNPGTLIYIYGQMPRE